MKKRLLVFHPALAPYRVDFFNELSEAFESWFYFSNDNLKEQKFNQKELRKECKFKFNLLEKGFEFGNRSIRIGIYSLLRKHQPQIVLCSEYSQITIFVLLIKIFLRQNLKVYTISDDSIDISIKRKGIRKWIRNLSSYALDGVIFPSENVCNWYKKNINNKTNLLCLPIVHNNSVYREKLNNALPLTRNILSEYNIDDKKIFLFVGRHIKIKNANCLINSYSETVKYMPNSLLFIIGEGEETENLKNLSSQLNLNQHCYFLGRYEGKQLNSWYNIADFLILPSYYEPYGAVVNEALLAGCKVICSNLAGASELITKDNGYLFNPFDENELSKILIQAYNEPKTNENYKTIRNDNMPFLLEDKIKSLILFLNENL